MHAPGGMVKTEFGRSTWSVATCNGNKDCGLDKVVSVLVRYEMYGWCYTYLASMLKELAGFKTPQTGKL